MTFAVWLECYSMHVLCKSAVSECMWLLRLSSVQTLKVGPDFAVISHPNGFCHTLLPTCSWKRTKSHEEKGKLNRHLICLLLALRTKVTLWL